ncbi:tyrosine-type recombinase/integrase [Cupriavidus metallidurans]|uniref:tyrosine-type recombinase/integrase n=1 Tax=Cupriavidus metallidurans TaxID=119219 RepID=UPI000AF1DA66|nr:site-specific integrase [Cupriavidus metallidurans]
MILNDDMTPAQPFHAYLRWLLLEKGKKLDITTWETYGRELWDFANYLHANDLAWDRPFESEGKSVVSVYRDWQAGDLKLEPSTINGRLERVVGMYEWAVLRGMTEKMPVSYSKVIVHGIESDFTHLTGGSRTLLSPDVLLDEWEKEPVFLTAEQVRIARSAIRSTAHRLLFDLMVRSGLRSCEARTFPRAYVFDPSARSDLKRGTLIEVALSPRDMEIKLKKPRTIHVPYSLMEEMHVYAQHERNRHVVAGRPQDALLLTEYGNAYSKGSAWKVMSDLGKRVGFRISPLMLRHSYAIHTLLLLRANPQIELEPLMYVRDRLGHENVQMTMVYLRQIERLLGAQALAMMEEFDNLYDVTPHLREYGANHSTSSL